jgi:hypothetical protein
MPNIPSTLLMSADEWRQVPILDLFHSDRRPIFVVDLLQVPPAVVYQNPAGEIFGACTRKIIWPDLRDASRYFMEWMVASSIATPYHYMYRGEWTTVTLKSRWRVVTGSLDSTESTAPVQNVQCLDLGGPVSMNPIVHDWTATSVPKHLTDYVRSLRDFDWAKTALGPIENWTPELRLMTNLILVCFSSVFHNRLLTIFARQIRPQPTFSGDQSKSYGLP